MPSRPSVQIYQEFTATPTTPVPELNGVLVGPRHDYMPYGDDAYAGAYDNTIENTFDYPNKAAIATVKTDKVKVYLNDAELKYFDKTAGAGVYDFRAVKQARNRITTVAAVEGNRLSFRETTIGDVEAPRSTVFYDRDVRNGDVVNISATIGVNEYTTKATVTGVVAEAASSVISSFTADSGNQGAETHAVALNGSGVSVGGDTLTPGGTYTGSLADGVVTDTYTITVIKQGGNPTIGAASKIVDTGLNVGVSSGSFNAANYDKYTVEVVTAGAPLTAELQVTSLRGDDDASVSFTAFDTPILLTATGVALSISNAPAGAGTAITSFTNATNSLNKVGHLLIADDPIMLASTLLLPAELSETTVYYAIITSPDVFQVSLTPGGVAVEFTDDGTGSATFHTPTGVLALGDKWTIEATPSNGKLSIYSESETDDTPSKTFPGFGFAFEIGNGVTISIADGGDLLLTVGDTWVIDATMTFVAVTGTSGGDYIGTKDLSYFAEVTQGGVWGECRVMFTSSGLDASGPYIVTNGVALPCGSYGATATFVANTQGGLLIGDKFSFSATAESDGAIKTLVLSKNVNTTILNNPPTVGSLTPGGGNTGTATLGGVYVDSLNVMAAVPVETYTVTITETYVEAPPAGLYTVASSSGLDDTAEAAVTLTALPLGTCGLTITPAGVPTLGDTYTVTITGTSLSVELLMPRNDFKLSQYRENIGFEEAWSASTAAVTVANALYLADDDWRAGLAFLPVEVGNIHISYQALVGGIETTIGSLESASEIAAALGTVSLENPLAYAASKFFENTDGNATCYYYKVSSDDIAGYTRFLDLVANSTIPYYMVPLTFDEDIQGLFINQCDILSTPEYAKWRRVFIVREREDVSTLMDTWNAPGETTGEDYTATIADYIDTLVTDYIYVEVEDPSTVNLLTVGIRAGDTFRTNYLTNPQGILEYSEYTIAGLLSETSLLLESGPAAPNPTAKKFTVHRTLSGAEMVTALSTTAQAIANRRVSLFLPDYITDDDDVLVPAYYAAAACAGYAASQAPHQGLTNYVLRGFSDTARTYVDFTQKQLDTLADAGYWIITQNTSTSIPKVRHQLTTDVSTIEYQEMSIGANIDHIAYYLHNILYQYIGRYNINKKTIGLIRGSLEAAIEGLKSVDYTTAGPQLINAVIEEIYQDPILHDHVRVKMLLTIPYPLNVLVVRLVI